MKDIWLENKSFILMAGGGLVVFLFLHSFATAYIENAEETWERSRSLRTKIVALHKDLKNSYWSEEAKVREYARIEESLRKEICSPEVDVAEGEGGQLRIKFDKAIASAWQSLRHAADRANLRLPAPLSSESDFRVDPGDGIDRYKTYYAYLAVARRALEIAIEARVSGIGEPELLRPEWLPVRGNTGVVDCLYRGVSVPVAGSFESLVRILELAQESGSFLQVRLQGVQARRSSGTEASELQADVEFFGLALVPAIEESGRGKGAAGRKETRGRKR